MVAEKLSKILGKEISACSNEEIYVALLKMTKDELAGKGYNEGKKKVYYISAEF